MASSEIPPPQNRPQTSSEGPPKDRPAVATVFSSSDPCLQLQGVSAGTLSLPQHLRWPRAVAYFQTKSCKIVSHSLRPEPPFTGVSGPSGPEIAKKISKRVFLGVWRKVSKNTRKKSENTEKKKTQKGPKIGIFRLFRVFFETFLQTPPKRPFLRLFCDFGETGGSGRNT